jgi:hypothetical protein
MRTFRERYRAYNEAIRPFSEKYDAELARIKRTTAEDELAAYWEYTEDCRPAWEALCSYVDDEQDN